VALLRMVPDCGEYGERGIRTLGTFWAHTLSKRAPSTTRTSLQKKKKKKQPMLLLVERGIRLPTRVSYARLQPASVPCRRHPCRLFLAHARRGLRFESLCLNNVSEINRVMLPTTEREGFGFRLAYHTLVSSPPPSPAGGIRAAYSSHLLGGDFGSNPSA
jgi:hypothetical protein